METASSRDSMVSSSIGLELVSLLLLLLVLRSGLLGLWFMYLAWSRRKESKSATNPSCGIKELFWGFPDSIKNLRRLREAKR